MECPDVFQPNVALLFVLLILFVSRLLRDDRERSFRRLSLRLHPERAARTSEEAGEVREAAFAVVAEAYEVLADPLKRAVYDQYGETGLKEGVRGPDGCIDPYVFHGRPLQTYRSFFGTENPYADLLDSYAIPPPVKECPDEEEKKKDEPLIMPLPLTLNEVFYGGIKKMKIQRQVLVTDTEGDDDDGATKPSTVSEEKILSIPIMPGMPAGTEIVFPEEGDQGPTKIPADIIFVTEDKPHEVFKREGSNLRMTVDVFISDALTGTIITVHTIDDRILRVPITSVISPDYVKTISGEGLPTVEDPDRHGDLLIGFRIEFPAYLTPASKSYVHQAFEPDGELTDEDKEEDKRRGSAAAAALAASRRPLVDGHGSARRIHLDGKLYMRADKLSEICRQR